MLSQTSLQIAKIRPVPLPKYASLVLASMERAIAYRKSTLLNLAANAVWITALYYFWSAILSEYTIIDGYDWTKMQTYVVVSYGVNALFSLQFELQMFRAIRNGEIALDLIRPYDYQTSHLAKATGAALVDGVFVGATIASVGVFIMDIYLPAPGTAAVFLVSIVLGFLIKFLISYITGLFCFWTVSSMGLVRTRIAVTNLLSGALIPIEFFPSGLQSIAEFSPFPAAVYTPVSIYLGNLAGGDLWTAIGVQVIWVIALWYVARLLWKPAVRVLVVQGG